MTATTTPEVLYTTVAGPLGELLLAGDGRALQRLAFPSAGGRPPVGAGWRHAEEPFADARRQLGEYFAGERTEFELTLDLQGSDFDRRVWAELGRIPYGRTAAYGDVARAIGAPGEARAVGAANARNPLAIVVPCHRVIGADGSLTGYGGGLDRKRALLELEGALLAV